MRKGMAYDGLLFPGTGCPVPDVAANAYVVWNRWSTGYTFCIYPPPRMLLSADCLGEKRMRQITMYLLDITFTCLIKHYQQESFSGFAVDSPCGVSCRRWTTCLLYGVPLLRLCFQMTVGVLVWYTGKGFSMYLRSGEWWQMGPLLLTWFNFNPSMDK